nr:hypothetical protein [Tanacetum cinerariifolium]
MTTVNQRMSVEEIECVVAQRVANAIEAIVIYETKTNLACKSMSQTERQKEKVEENASNKRKWEVSVPAAPRAVDLADSPVSTSIDQDAPSTTIPSTQDQEHSLIISQGFEELTKTQHFHDDPLHEFIHEDSTS